MWVSPEGMQVEPQGWAEVLSAALPHVPEQAACPHPPSAREALLPTHCEPRENLFAKSFGIFLIENKNEKNKQKRWKTKNKP